MLIVPEEPGDDTLRVPVLRVFDGDGFLTRIVVPGRGVEVEAAVRFGFIDAPELGQPGGHEARDFLTNLIGGRWVDLGILLKMDTGSIIDGHGRIVAVPYLRLEGSVCRNVELEMVLNGWAWVLDRYEPDDRYFAALDDAQRHRRGIWARDENKLDDIYETERRLLYVACTRARDSLLVTGVKPGSEFLSDLARNLT